jgi:hypothetical protein
VQSQIALQTQVKEQTYMSTIAGVASTTNSHQTADQNGFAQIIKDFNSMGRALQSGQVSTAQTALSAFQQDLQGNARTSASQPFGNNSQANTDYQSLVGALQSGDLSSAQKAFASLKTDLNAAQTSTKTARRGHHHRGSGGASAGSLINGLTTSPTATPANSTSTSWPTTSTNSTTASSPTASANGTTTSSTADSGGDKDGSTLNVTA